MLGSGTTSSIATAPASTTEWCIHLADRFSDRGARRRHSARRLYQGLRDSESHAHPPHDVSRVSPSLHRRVRILQAHRHQARLFERAAGRDSPRHPRESRHSASRSRKSRRPLRRQIHRVEAHAVQRRRHSRNQGMALQPGEWVTVRQPSRFRPIVRAPQRRCGVLWCAARIRRGSALHHIKTQRGRSAVHHGRPRQRSDNPFHRPRSRESAASRCRAARSPARSR